MAHQRSELESILVRVVGYIGPALGGGHGWLQGRHGTIGDQFESANIVLATFEPLKVRISMAQSLCSMS
jgi:FAD/FMN-containing dehydrogenase